MTGDGIQNTMQNNLRKPCSLIVADHVPGLSGSSEKHDLPVRTWHLPNVRRPNVGVSNMSQGGGQTYSALLKIKDCHHPHCALEFFKVDCMTDEFIIHKNPQHFARGNVSSCALFVSDNNMSS